MELYWELGFQTDSKVKILNILEEITGVDRKHWEIDSPTLKEYVVIRNVYTYMLLNHAKFKVINICHMLGLDSTPSVMESLNEIDEWKANPAKFQSQLELLNKTIELFDQQ